MRNYLIGAVGASLALAVPVAQPIAQAQAADPNYRLTQSVRRLSEQARIAISQNNFPAASGYLSQAAGQARSDGDRYLVATMQLDVGNRTFSPAVQMQAINALIQNPLVGDAQRADLYYHRGRLAYHAQDADTAHDMLQSAVDSGAANPNTFIALASLKALRGDNAAALQLIDRAAGLQQAATIPVSDHWYRRAIHIAEQLGDPARIAQISQALLAAYPNARNWRDALTIYRRMGNPDQSATIDLWRLQAAAGALAGERDYLNYARAASAVNALPEIERLVRAGRDNGMLDAGNGELNALDRGTTRAAQQLRAAIAGRAERAANSSTGVAAIDVANDYLALGDYAAAATLYRTAIEKGGVETDLANLRLGIALAQAGDVDGARAALDAVTGDRATVARFWRVYADTRPPMPVAPAAPAEG